MNSLPSAEVVPSTSINPKTRVDNKSEVAKEDVKEITKYGYGEVKGSSEDKGRTGDSNTEQIW